MVEALRAADAAAVGLAQRETAALLFGTDAASGWPGLGGSLQSRVRRRIALGRKMILDGPTPIFKRP